MRFIKSFILLLARINDYLMSSAKLQMQTVKSNKHSDLQIFTVTVPIIIEFALTIMFY